MQDCQNQTGKWIEKSSLSHSKRYDLFVCTTALISFFLEAKNGYYFRKFDDSENGVLNQSQVSANVLNRPKENGHCVSPNRKIDSDQKAGNRKTNSPTKSSILYKSNDMSPTVKTKLRCQKSDFLNLDEEIRLYKNENYDLVDYKHVKYPFRKYTPKSNCSSSTNFY